MKILGFQFGRDATPDAQAAVESLRDDIEGLRDVSHNDMQDMSKAAIHHAIKVKLNQQARIYQQERDGK